MFGFFKKRKKKEEAKAREGILALAHMNLAALPIPR